ncbi:transmembrane protein [Anaeramoeba flamelloides]|uniref:Transmembrane protein n=1 Tax=Anaeramoeba flamelloides TaxID=1746091 RepID=A0ABQ8YE72_9EUKA|nr:transmembrane protein [Anaeramoeba flamelloides]
MCPYCYEPKDVKGHPLECTKLQSIIKTELQKHKFSYIITKLNVQTCLEGKEVIDLFIDNSKFLIQASCLTISEGVDCTLAGQEMGGSGGNWIGDTEVYYFDNDAARSGACSDWEESWFSTEISDIGYISFYWKVSSEEDYDFLRFYIDGELQDEISGEVDWIKKTYTVDKESTHILEWRYSKDGSAGDGMDCGWVDQLVLEESQPTITLGDALDNQDLTFTTGGDPEWYQQEEEYHYDNDAARSGDCKDNQESWFSTEISGKGYISFYWKVSSEDNWDYLQFYIDGELQDRISGNVDWIKKTYTVDKESTYTLKWVYSKDGSYGDGMDCGWVDKLVIEESQPPITLGDALDNQDLNFTIGGDSNWYGQEKEDAYYDKDVARSGNCQDNQESWFSTEISHKGYISFYWKVSSEPDYDFLQFYIDGELQDEISGEVAWVKKTYLVEKESTHTLKWEYYKDQTDGGTTGSDCGWVDKLVIEETKPPVVLGEALDNQDLNFTIGGNSDWYEQKEYYYYENDAARSGDCKDNEESWFSTEISDIAYISFYWKVSSELNYDFLRFYIDGELQDQISGEVDWIKKGYLVEKESTHTLKWEYSKNGWDSDKVGMDCGWVDKLVLEDFDTGITLGEALDNQDLTFTTGGDSDWYVQEKYYRIGNSAVRSGPLTSNGTWMKTTIEGKGKLSFSWGIASYNRENTLILKVDSEIRAVYENYNIWEEVVLYIHNEGMTEIQWLYIMNPDCDTHAIVDNVQFEKSQFQISLNEALDNEKVNITTQGDSEWHGQDEISISGNFAAISGGVEQFQASYMHAKLNGKGQISFYWKVSSEDGFDFLEFYVDGKFQEKISGEVDWAKKSYTIPQGGDHKLSWVFSKKTSTSIDKGMGWVDALTFIEDISEDENDDTSQGYNIFSYSFAFFLCLFYFIVSFF